MTTSVTKTVPSAKLTLKDRLSRLTFGDACKLSGPKARKLIQKNANAWEFTIAEHVFLGELVVQESPAGPAPEALVANLRQGLGACVEDDPTGKPRLTITLPDRAALDNLAQILAKLLAAAPADRAESER